MNAPITVQPMDAHNRALVQNVRPPDWEPPEPDGPYNLVIIGAGTGGLVTAAGAAGLGARVALVESHLMGGDCLNVGCVPSKCLIRSARFAAEARRAQEFGAELPGEVTVDFAKVMERMRSLRSRISGNDSAQRFRELGVDVYFGHARFTGEYTVEVAGKTLEFHRAVIATGARAVRPEGEGLEEAGFLTNETLFNLTELPRRLAVFGAGPLGCEMAQAFARLGSQVTIIERKGRLLTKEDPDAMEIVNAAFRRDGIDIRINTTVVRCSRQNGVKQVHVLTEGRKGVIECDEILVGAGRRPNVEGMDLEKMNIEYDTRHGVKVDDYLRTTNPGVYAVGDVCLDYKFTHAADAAARIVIQNALFPVHKRFSALVIPWCTYTDPEIAHVGLYEHEAEARGLSVATFMEPLAHVDRAVVDGETAGMVKVHVEEGTDHILGATIVATHAGEMINEITLAMAHGIGLGAISNVIHPYPTQSEAIRRVADAWNRTRLKPMVKAVLKKVLEWER